MSTTVFDLQQPAADERPASPPDAETPDAETIAVRAWARSRGYPIDETSGVPLSVLRTYRRVHAG